MGHDYDEREERKGDADHEDAGAENHGEEGKALEEGEVEHGSHFFGDGLLWRLGGCLGFEVGGRNGFIADETPQRVDRGFDVVA